MSAFTLKPDKKKVLQKALEDLMDTPGLYVNNHYEKKWKKILEKVFDKGRTHGVLSSLEGSDY